jgi:diguanylate cyclase (GGDEF)-like protein
MVAFFSRYFQWPESTRLNRMPPAPKADRETRRLIALESYRILDTEFEEAFDRYTRLAAVLIDAPIAAISFVDAERQWFKSVIGMTLRETPRDVSFCAHAILQQRPLIVQDASLDPRFCDNPLVTSEPGLRFYAGAPLRTPDGENIGTICVLDPRPRDLTAEQQRSLADIADSVVTTLELYKTLREMSRMALTDSLTELPNRIQFFNALNATIADSNRTKRPFSLLYLDCDEFKRVNDTLGHEAGDRLLRRMSSGLQNTLRGRDLAARLGGDEFAVILPELGPRASYIAANRLLNICNATMQEGDYTTTLSIGLASFLCPPASADIALAEADKAMYQAKNSGKNNIHAVVVRDQAVLRLVASRAHDIRSSIPSAAYAHS